MKRIRKTHVQVAYIYCIVFSFIGSTNVVRTQEVNIWVMLIKLVSPKYVSKDLLFELEF